MCPTSNVHTGAAPSIESHPIDLLRRLRFRVTVNTDNRLMSGVSLSSEFAALDEAFGIGLGEMEWLTLNAMKSAFAPFDERLGLINEVIKPGYARLRAEEVPGRSSADRSALARRDRLQPVVGRVESTLTDQGPHDLDRLGDALGERRDRGRPVDRFDPVVVDLGREGEIAGLELDALGGSRHDRLDGGRQGAAVGDRAGQVEDMGALDASCGWPRSGSARRPPRTGRSSGRRSDSGTAARATAAAIALVGPLVIPWSRPTP